MSQAVTPELRQWIVEQARVGCKPEAVLKAMTDAGWQEDVALDALEKTLGEHLEQQRAAAQQPAPLPVPTPDLRSSPRRISPCWNSTASP